MKLLANRGNERVIDELRAKIGPQARLDVASPAVSLFAFHEMRDVLARLSECRLVLPDGADVEAALLGEDADRAYRNQLEIRALATDFAAWLTSIASVRSSPRGIGQATLVVRSNSGAPAAAMTGTNSLTTPGLGITPSRDLSLVQATDAPEEAASLAKWFDALWDTLPPTDNTKQRFVESVRALSRDWPAELVYLAILHHLFSDSTVELDEDQIIKSATGIRDTAVWKRLFKFQRDGVIGAIDKLNRFGGCIIADSVGLGKTFEALAVIKYHELRNDRVLVLVPKRLRDNWTLYKANDRRNPLASDRFNYDVLNHTDLSRDDGMSGDIDLSYVNWGNYDLVVIDESHNFRNKNASVEGDTRYDRLMRRIIQEGVKTRVLMLSATPVNNRLADLKNQIAFITEADDGALSRHGVRSIETTIRLAQAQFNRWLQLSDAARKPERLLEMLGFDYFALLDLLTIARSRKHIERYYGLDEVGTFPDRLKPINLRPDIDLRGEFQPVREVNNEIRRLTLAVYAPLQYVLPHRQAAYDEKYSQKVRGGTGFFRQADREASLIHLMRVNVLKRMESSVVSFALTLRRQLADIDATLARIESQADDFEEFDIADAGDDDPVFESLTVGRKVKVLLQDMDLVRWKQDLREDRQRIAGLLDAAEHIDPARDAKLKELQDAIREKVLHPLNLENRKVLVFTAFADTARYLYEYLAPWAVEELGIHTAMVTGTGGNQTTLTGLRRDMGNILTAFAPRAKERPAEFDDDGSIDLLIATDCISEGQNLQDCDTVVNYDIHWNPVRIIQRFGRIDRIGSPNARIQLINFWPNIELEEYINLESRVSGRMVLLDISATGEENVIEYQPGNQMNDLEYRRDQLLKLQDTVIDLEDLSSGVSITDLTLNDFRIDLAGFTKDHPDVLGDLPFGTLAVTCTADDDIPPGVIFCLRAVGEGVLKVIDPAYPLAPHFVVHVGEGGAVLLPFTQAKQVLDRLRRLASGKHEVDAEAVQRFDRATKGGRDMSATRELLARAVASVAGKGEERAVASLFTPGGTHALQGEFHGIDDFEVLAYLVVLPPRVPA